MPTIIMTIKRRHLRNMESGLKRYELRKTAPSIGWWRTPPCRVLLCVSGGRGEIAADFELDRIIDLTNTPPTFIARLACVTAAEAERYRAKGRGKLYGWRVGHFRKYPVKDMPTHINDIGLTRPPQSWQYVRVPYGALRID